MWEQIFIRNTCIKLYILSERFAKIKACSVLVDTFNRKLVCLRLLCQRPRLSWDNWEKSAETILPFKIYSELVVFLSLLVPE